MEQIANTADLDFSLISLALRASPVVQVVLVILLLASVWTWALIISKAIAFAADRRRLRKFEDRFWSGRPLDELADELGERPSGAAQRIFVAGMDEWRRSHVGTEQGDLSIPGAHDRIDRAMSVAIARDDMRTKRGLGWLATIGATAPFIGLFGTVWGIKSAFEGIAASNDSSLATVAPGIAEALIATALGLFAAIPAVIFYNKLTADAERLSRNREIFADEFSTLLSRQLAED